MTQESNEYTLGEFEEMDLSGLKDEVFMVAINTGPRNKYRYLCASLTGPFNFYEMIEQATRIYQEHQIHAKVMICSKELGIAPRILDENTIDFIEARGDEIVMDGMLGGDLMEQKEYTCRASFIPEEQEDEQDCKD